MLGIFDPKPGEVYIDATANGGGHSRAIAERVGPGGRVIGIDWDCALANQLQTKNREWGIKNIEVVCGNYADMKALAGERGITHADGVLFDLGFSSYHVERSGRGFSFLKDEPLDMRYDPNTNDLTAEKILNTFSEESIAALLRDSGEERNARRIAAALVRGRGRRRITRTAELVSLINGVVRGVRGRIHPATRVFQALRIAVNRELDNLARGLEAAEAILGSGGKIIAISFHSLEDRVVKNFFRKNAREEMLAILTPKPIRPSPEEIQKNPSSRSARLRAAQKKIL